MKALLRCVNPTVLKDDTVSEVSLQGSSITVGRGVTNDVVLKAEGVSRTHARLVFQDGIWQVQDLGSSNGTRVNSSLVKGRRPLQDGDTVTIGRAIYKFVRLAGPAPAAVRDLDLGGHLQTVAISQQEMEAGLAEAAAAKAARTTTRPAAAGAAGRHKRGKRRPEKGSRVMLWLIVALAAIVLAAVVEFVLRSL